VNNLSRGGGLVAVATLSIYLAVARSGVDSSGLDSSGMDRSGVDSSVNPW